MKPSIVSIFVICFCKLSAANPTCALFFSGVFPKFFMQEAQEITSVLSRASEDTMISAKELEILIHVEKGVSILKTSDYLSKENVDTSLQNSFIQSFLKNLEETGSFSRVPFIYIVDLSLVENLQQFNQLRSLLTKYGLRQNHPIFNATYSDPYRGRDPYFDVDKPRRLPPVDSNFMGI